MNDTFSNLLISFGFKSYNSLNGINFLKHEGKGTSAIVDVRNRDIVIENENVLFNDYSISKLRDYLIENGYSEKLENGGSCCGKDKIWSVIVQRTSDSAYEEVESDLSKEDAERIMLSLKDLYYKVEIDVPFGFSEKDKVEKLEEGGDIVKKDHFNKLESYLKVCEANYVVDENRIIYVENDGRKYQIFQMSKSEDEQYPKFSIIVIEYDGDVAVSDKTFRTYNRDGVYSKIEGIIEDACESMGLHPKF